MIDIKEPTHSSVGVDFSVELVIKKLQSSAENKGGVST